MDAGTPEVAEGGRLRVVIVNFNGGSMTLDSVEDVIATEWPGDVEIVVVDNASTDGVAAEIERRWPSVVVRRSPVNLGFAGGCNAALGDLDGVAFVALVNNDLRPPPRWLLPLHQRIVAEPRVGAASPKMLFDGKFLRLSLRSTVRRRSWVDRRLVGVRVSEIDGHGAGGVKPQFVSGFFGNEHGGASEPEFQWTGAEATLHIPVSGGSAPTSCRLRLGADASTTLVATSADQSVTLQVKPGVGWYEVPLGGEPFDVVNNLGSELTEAWYGADRGFQRPDDDQGREVEVFAWSGGAALLRAEYLHDVGLFDDRLFLYYEDLELSWRGRTRGWRYVHVPGSVVRHIHSATVTSGSPLARYYNERNRLAVLARHAPWPVVGRAIVAFVSATASYAWRDIGAPLLTARRPQPGIVWVRLRAFAGFLRLAPAMLVERRGRRRVDARPARPVKSPRRGRAPTT